MKNNTINKLIDSQLEYNCLECDKKEGCCLLEALYGIDYCEVIKLMKDPKEYLREYSSKK